MTTLIQNEEKVSLKKFAALYSSDRLTTLSQHLNTLLQI